MWHCSRFAPRLPPHYLIAFDARGPRRQERRPAGNARCCSSVCTVYATSVQCKSAASNFDRSSRNCQRHRHAEIRGPPPSFLKPHRVKALHNKPSSMPGCKGPLCSCVPSVLWFLFSELLSLGQVALSDWLCTCTPSPEQLPLSSFLGIPQLLKDKPDFDRRLQTCVAGLGWLDCLHM